MQKPLSSQVWPRCQAGQMLGGGVREEGEEGSGTSSWVWMKLGGDSNSVGSEAMQFERIVNTKLGIRPWTGAVQRRGYEAYVL